MPDDLLARLGKLRQYRRRDGQRSPHKPLLVLLALGRVAATGSSELPWAEAEPVLADLISEFGPSSRTRPAQSAAYPFTRLRNDGIWILNQDVPMDDVRPLTKEKVAGRLEPSLEASLRSHPELIWATARELVLSNFPASVAPDVLTAAGLDPGMVLGAATGWHGEAEIATRRREPSWRVGVLRAWDRQCAFCGYDGQLASATVGIDAAHIQWFAFGGPDSLDNALALCVLHHKLFDLGALGLNYELRVLVSQAFTARTDAGRAIYALHGRKLTPRPGTITPAPAHVAWHAREVFKGEPLPS